MTQCDRILRHLREVGPITPIDALRDYGCMRLAARIGELRAEGYAIVKDREQNVNRYGERVTYAKYQLVGQIQSHFDLCELSK